MPDPPDADLVAPYAEEAAISPVGRPMEGDVLRRQALNMAIDAKARGAEDGDVLELAARFESFLKGIRSDG